MADKLGYTDAERGIWQETKIVLAIAIAASAALYAAWQMMKD